LEPASGRRRPPTSAAATVHPGATTPLEFIHDHNHQQWLSRYAKHLCDGDPIQADEIVQQTLIKLWENRDRYSTVNRSFVASMLLHHHIDRFRQAQREREHLRAAAPILGPSESPRRDLVAQIAAREELRQCLSLLQDRPRQQEVYFLADYANWKVRDIADYLRLDPRTVSNYLSLARSRLRSLRPQ
jgi:RNA polymerase sigma factor (sigma-70 family)